MSIELLKDPKKPHTILDDLESFFWVLTFMAIHYLPNTFPAVSLDMFDECAHDPVYGYVGGRMKGDFVISDIEKYSFACAPLNRLHHQLRSFFGNYGIMKSFDKPKFLEMQSRLMKDPSEILTFFDDALQSLEWPADDKISNRLPLKTLTASATRGVVEKETGIRLGSAAALPIPGPSTSHILPPTSASHNSATDAAVPVAVPPTPPLQASSSSPSSSKRPATEREVEAKRPKLSKMPRKSKPWPPSVPVHRSLRSRTISSSDALGSSARNGAYKRTLTEEMQIKLTNV